MHGNAPTDAGVTMYDFILFQHADGRSPNFYCLYKHPITRKQCHFSCRTTDREEALRYATRTLPQVIRQAYERERDGNQGDSRLRGSSAQIRSKLQQTLTTITIKEYAQRYIANHRTKRGQPLRGKSRTTLLDTFNQFDKYVNKVLDMETGQSPYLHAVTQEICRAFIHERPTSDRSAEKHCISLRAAFRTAVADGFIGCNYFENVTPPKPEYTDDQIEDRYFTEEEFVRYVKQMPMRTFAQRRLRRMLLLANEAGLRLGELRHVKMKWLDMTNGLLRVRSDGDFRTKTRSSQRTIPLSRLAVEIIESQLDENSHHRKQLIRESEYLFPSERGLPLSESGIENPFREIRKLVFGDIRKPKIHGLRHAFVTRLATAGVPDRIVQSVTGHDTRAMIDRYAHVGSHAIEPVRQVLNNTSRLDTDALLNSHFDFE